VEEKVGHYNGGTMEGGRLQRVEDGKGKYNGVEVERSTGV
jgi:hypothetical protein